MIKLLILSGGRQGAEKAFDQPTIYIGRSPDCDLQLDPNKDLIVHKKHARIYFNGDFYFLEDIGSRNGIFVNQTHITKPITLNSGTIFQLGRTGPKIQIEYNTSNMKKTSPANRLATSKRPQIKRRKERYFGSYKVIEKVASGTMGTVYKVEDTRDGEIKALKILRHANEEAIGRFFRREAATMQKIRSPGVISLLDYGEMEGHCFITMNFVEGTTLDNYWQDLYVNNPESIMDESMRIIKALGQALGDIHSEGITHRDIKPANVLMDCKGSLPMPQITDFSLAVCMGEHERMTGTGVTLGSPYYMAPEQTLGLRRKIGPATDVYALGIVFYELLSADLPFRAADLQGLYKKIQNEKPQPLSLKNPEVPNALEKIIYKCLKKNPEQRYQNGKEFVKELNYYLKTGKMLSEKGRWNIFSFFKKKN